MYTPRDIEHLILRIEALQRKRTADFDGGDELEFRRSLPTSDPAARLQPGRLPNPVYLRLMADRLRRKDDVTEEERRDLNAACRQGVTVAMRLESLVHKNDPRNPQRLVRDMMRGKVRLH